MRRITIAIDGYSSCGKSTLAKQLAHHLHYTYIDSGAMYRAVALFALENGLIRDGRLDREALLRELPGLSIAFRHDDQTQRSETWLNGRNVEHLIRGMEVSQAVTLVSPIKEVRAKLVALQRAMGDAKGVVMDGRDIGTVVLPDAKLKVYLDASLDERARRRWAEHPERPFEQVRAELAARDLQDSTRATAPLRCADDAVRIDSTGLPIDEVVGRIVALAQARRA